MRRLWLLLVLALLCGRAAAHLMPQGQGAVRFDEAGAMAMVAMPLGAFQRGAPASRRMDAAEFARTRDALQQQLPALLAFRRDGVPGRVLVSQVMMPGAHELGTRKDTDHLIALLRVVWDAPARGEVTLDAPWLAQGAATIVLRAERKGKSEVVTLGAQRTRHRFFANAPEALPLRSH